MYGNVGLCTIVPVKVEDLWDYVKANKINDAEGLKREYRVRVLEYIQLNIDINTLQKGMKLIYLAKIFMDLLFIIIWLFFPQLIPAGLTASCEVAKKPENKDKNRYGNIIACKSTKAKMNVFRRCKSDCVCLNFIQLFGFVDISDDHSRVVLKPVHGDIHDDFTNANYIEVRGLTWIFLY